MTEPTPLEETDAPAAPPRLSDVPIMLFVRGVAAVVLVLALLIALHVYIGSRLFLGLGLTGASAAAGWAVVWTAFGSIFFGFIGGRVFPKPVAKAAQWVGFGWMGSFGLLLTGTVASDVAVAVAVRWFGAELAQARFVAAVTMVAVVVPVLALGAFIARTPKVKRLELEVAGLAGALDGFTLAQLSDVHIGETLGREWARRLVERVNALNAHAVVVTGDLVDGSVPRLTDEVAPLSGLKAKHGVYFVTGNHEYYHGGDAWEAEARRLGMTVLHNEHRVLGEPGAQLVLGGVPDVEGARFSRLHVPDAGKTFHGAPSGVPRVLLAHQPRFARHAQGHGVDLMLSGHTHGGQIFPFMFLVRLQQPVIAGLRELWGVRTYTSAGTGYWGPPFRVATRGEITLVTLRAPKA